MRNQDVVSAAMKTNNEIKEPFLAVINDEDGDTVSALKDAVAALRAKGLSLHDAATVATHWACEAGLFDPEFEKDAEEQAEKIVQAAE